MQSFRRAWNAFNQTEEATNPHHHQTSRPSFEAPGTGNANANTNSGMDDPLSLLANQASQKRQSTNTLINEMEDLENHVIPHTLNKNGSPNNKRNNRKGTGRYPNQNNNNITNISPNQNIMNNKVTPNGINGTPIRQQHYRSVSHNTPSPHALHGNPSAFANFTNQQRKSNHRINGGLSYHNNINNNHNNNSNNSNLNNNSINSNSQAINESPQPMMPDEDGDIANESIFAMDHRTTHNWVEIRDENLFGHELHSLDLSKNISNECLMFDEISHRGTLHNECIMMHVHAYFIQYKPDTKEDVIIPGELYLSNYLLYFEPQSLSDVPGGMSHLVVPIHSVGKVSDNQAKYRRDNSGFELEITTRDYRVLRFRFGLTDKQSSYSYNPEKVQQMLKLLAFPPEPIHMFAFQHARRHPLINALNKQNEEKNKLLKLRKLKEKDLIKQEMKLKRKQMTNEKKSHHQHNRSNSMGLKKPKQKKKKLRKSKSKSRKSKLKKANSNPKPIALDAPTRDDNSNDNKNETSTKDESQTNETNEDNDNNTKKTEKKDDKSDNNDNDNNNDDDNNKDENKAENENNEESKKDGLLQVEGNDRNELSITPSPSPGVSDMDMDMDDSQSETDGDMTDSASVAPSTRSQGSTINIQDITMEMIDEKERLFLQNEIWGWHTYNVQKEFERMGITMDDPNQAAANGATDDVSNLMPTHTFSDPASRTPTNHDDDDENENENANDANDIDNETNNGNLNDNDSSNNNNNKPKLPTYDAPTPSLISGQGSASASSIERPLLENRGTIATTSNAADMALNHGRSQTQADLQSLKRYRQQLQDTRMSTTNYPRYRFTTANAYYELCDTYTTLLVVPMAITDWELAQVARFRRLGRIPVLTWKSKDNNVAMFRCSQPKVGIASNRSRFDEHLIRCIVDANTSVKNSILYIMDARPRLNAQANKIKGAGFENVNFYKNVILEFLNVHNIHAMRKSRKALAQIIHQPKHKDKEWLTVLDATEWMTHIREILKGTLAIVNVMTLKQCSVLCHCSDGWDRTSQLCGLSQLCLDSYYRTIKGFIVLIDKEWLSFGHQFGKRVGHGKDDGIEDDERSPVFEQFIDCTYHLTQQFPTAFEFNDKFLIEILDHVYDCRFGTFLFDCHKQRTNAKLESETLSLWSYLQNCSHRSQFLNTFYVATKEILYPRFSSKILKFWNNHYLRHCPQHVLSPEPIYSENRDIEDQFLKLKVEVEKLQEQIRVMKTSKVIEEDELD